MKRPLIGADFFWVLPLLVVALIPGLAIADGTWTASFPADSVGTYLGDGRPAVVVVPAGESSGRSVAATKPLVEAMRASGKARLVMDAAVLGDVSALGDEEIVKKAAELPVELIAVVRIFPGADDSKTAVVTFYNKKGKAHAAFTARQGKAIDPRNEGGSEGQGVSSKAAGAVSRVLKEEGGGGRSQLFDDSPDGSPAGEYRRRHIGFIRYKWISDRGGEVKESWGGPFQGAGKRSLSPLAFYRLLGREGEMDSYRRRGRLKLGLIISGAAVATAGGIMALVGGLEATKDSDVCAIMGYSICREYEKRDPDFALMGAGIGTFVVGVGALIGGLVLDRSPTTREEDYRLAAEYNRALRKELGLPDKPDPDLPGAPRDSASAGPRIVVAPLFTGRSGGLGVRVSF